MIPVTSTVPLKWQVEASAEHFKGIILDVDDILNVPATPGGCLQHAEIL